MMDTMVPKDAHYAEVRALRAELDAAKSVVADVCE